MFHAGSRLSEIAKTHQGLEEVLARYGFDPSTFHRKLSDVCADVGLNARLLLVILEAYRDPAHFPAVKLSTFPVPQIIDFLQKTHRHYIYKRLPEVERSIYDLAMETVLQAEKLEPVNALYLSFKAGLHKHIAREETQLFPYILYLHDVGYNEFNLMELHGKMDQNSIANFACEHDEICRRLQVMKRLLQDEYLRSASRSRICVRLQKEMEGFGNDLLLHGRIEDEVLVKRAVLLEQEIREQVS